MISRVTAKCVLSLCFAWVFFAAPAPVKAAPFASIVVDATTGRTLQQYRADQNRYPASLTKLMTVYIMLEEIAAGRLKPDTPIYMSRNASKQPPSKLGLKRGHRLPARIAMQALIVKSANDVATAVAEHISGSEAKFARRMTKTARRIGLYDTHFINASGLYHWRQQTTARDMAKLAKALLKRFPHFESMWQTTSFRYDGTTYTTHNHVLRRLEGAMGMKTGYIRASGYNIATAVQRDGKRIIIVVIGGRTASIRNRHVMSLAERSLPRATAFETGKPAREKLQLAASWLGRPVAALTQPTQGLKLAQLPKDWKIQVGAFSASNHAQSQLQRVRRLMGDELQHAQMLTEEVEKNGRPVYRARFANLSEPQAFDLCHQLRNVTPSCLPIAP